MSTDPREWRPVVSPDPVDLQRVRDGYADVLQVLNRRLLPLLDVPDGCEFVFERPTGRPS